MQAQGANKQDLLNELINNLFEHIQNQEVKSTRMYQIVESMIEVKSTRMYQIYQIVESMIDDRDNAIIQIENGSLKSRLQTLDEFRLANQVLDNGGRKDVNNIPELLKLCIDNPSNFMKYIRQQDFERWLNNTEIRETELANIAQGTREKNFPNDDERLHYFLRECCLVLIGRNP
ncbi:MAG: hypothetical protein RLZZ143_2015 [Cyanobacteriota bacterium]